MQSTAAGFRAGLMFSDFLLNWFEVKSVNRIWIVLLEVSDFLVNRFELELERWMVGITEAVEVGVRMATRALSVITSSLMIPTVH